jgi:hypothetical protein
MRAWGRRIITMLGERVQDGTSPAHVPAAGEAGGYDEPPIGAASRDEEIRWDHIFAVFLRLVAVLWMLKGFAHWALILGLGDLPLAEETLRRQAIIIAFAILHCAASVGLWLLSPWGKSLWVFLVIVEVALGVTGYAQGVSPATASATFFIALLFLLLSFAIRYTKR